MLGHAINEDDPNETMDQLMMKMMEQLVYVLIYIIIPDKRMNY